MILNLILTLFIGLFAYLLRESTKENRKLLNDAASYQVQVKRLSLDIEVSQRQKDNLEERNTYLAGRLDAFIQENESLGIKNDELNSLYSLAKEEQNSLRYQLIKLEESMPLVKGAEAKTKKGISENISREKKANPEMDVKQAAAIAYSQARGGKPKKGAKKK